MGCSDSKSTNDMNTCNIQKTDFLKQEEDISPIVDEWLNLFSDGTSEVIKYIKTKSREDFIGRKNELFKFFKDLPTKDEYQKLWAIYFWITNNISFNIDYLRNSKIEVGCPINTGVSLSQGFSVLTKELCNACGLKCEIITGWSKAFGYQPGQKIYGRPVDHSWNKVLVRGEWKFLDCTWGEGFSTSDYKATKCFNRYWFLVPPKVFIYKHFPENAIDQGLEKQITMSQFEKTPKFELSYFVHRFNIIDQHPATFDISYNPFIINVSCKNNNYSLICSLTSLTEKKSIPNSTLVLKKDVNNFEVNVLGGKGTCILSLFGGKTSEDKHDLLVEYVITNKSEENKNQRWCKTYSVPYPVYLFEPKFFNLEIGKKIKFKVKVNAFKVAVVEENSNTWTYLENKGLNIWELNKAITKKGTIGIYVKPKEDSEKFNAVFEYQAE